MASPKLLKGVRLTIKNTREYRTSDGRVHSSATGANKWQTYINRIAAMKAVLRKSGLLAYKSNDNIVSVGVLADRMLDPAFIAKLERAAKVRTSKKA